MENLPNTLKQQSRYKNFSKVIDNVIRLPSSKTVLTDSTIREIAALIRAIRLYDVSSLSFKQRKLRTLLNTLEKEIEGEKQLEIVQLQLGLIRDELTIR